MKEIRRIPLEGLHNTRDLGGFETADGKKIRPRRLLRSGQLAGMTETDKQILTHKSTACAQMWTSAPDKNAARPRIPNSPGWPMW